ncbi:hypothetical protein ElyMa_005528000 [Elysia marginata]|uniref:Uncharacterized protein n=1 Tax=Elysia marginata TaxID=1093978 RepID=A0AAV4EWM7_9GAST|nr:hypothetical protein ElyMa_005528000 [Elysia marginata]
MYAGVRPTVHLSHNLSSSTVAEDTVMEINNHPQEEDGVSACVCGMRKNDNDRGLYLKLPALSFSTGARERIIEQVGT